jgi:hypothetical protein
MMTYEIYTLPCIIDKSPSSNVFKINMSINKQY